MMGHSSDSEPTETLEAMRRVRGDSLGPVPVPSPEPVDDEPVSDEPHVVPGPHGTRKHYEYGGCRCDECKAANRAHKAQYR